MSEADYCIAALDYGLAQYGEDIVLQRFTADSQGVQTVAFEALCRATVRSHLPQELVHVPFEAPATKVVISPTPLTLVGWPGLPVKDDRLIIDGQPNNIETVSPIRVDGVLLRIDITCIAVL
jgi:hypothetical protein